MTGVFRASIGAAALALAVTMVSCTDAKPHAGPTPAFHCPTPSGILSVGEKIPTDCSLERLDGEIVRLSDLLGKPAVINFWASWCTFCISEMPGLQKVYASLGGRVSFLGADLLGVQGESKGAATTFARSTGVHYPLVYDRGGILYGHFSARPVMPTTIIVRADGVVADRRFGPLTETQLRDLLRQDVGVQ